MSERERYPPGVPCWVETLQPDPQSALEFYGRLFGWVFEGPGPMPGGLPGQYFVARARGRDIAGIGSLPDLGGPSVPSWNTYVRVDNVDEAVERALAVGGGLLVGALDAFPAGRLAVLSDPAGAVISVWEARAREGAQLVNEPGTWMMSSLHTSDSEGARTFYESMFGWQSEPFGPAKTLLTLWRLPGYLGGEQGQRMPRDVVAVMAPTGIDESNAAIPTHWNVNFLVEDADVTIERATSLAGRVVVPPQDTPGFRRAALADPQGAVFSISQLTPRLAELAGGIAGLVAAGGTTRRDLTHRWHRNARDRIPPRRRTHPAAAPRRLGPT